MNFRVPAPQGALDSACGLYAVVNAAYYVGAARSKNEVYNLVLGSYSNDSNIFRKLLLDGTSARELQEMMKKCEKVVPVKFLRLGGGAARIDSTWVKITAALNDNRGSCVVVGIDYADEDTGHWTVVNQSSYDASNKSGRLSLYEGGTEVGGMNYGSMGAGKSKNISNTEVWLVTKRPKD